MKQAIENYKKLEAREKAMMIVKYQNFKTDIALKKMEKKVSKAIFNAGVSYLKRGKMVAPLSNVIKEAIDIIQKECIQPLRPAQNEKRIFKKEIYQAKEVILPITKIIPKKITALFDYGVFIGNNIRLFDSEKEARIFLEGIKFMNGQGKLVEVEKKEIE